MGRNMGFLEGKEVRERRCTVCGDRGMAFLEGTRVKEECWVRGGEGGCTV